MSNIKRIVIEGELPFNCIEVSEDCKSLLAQLNAPSSGIRIDYPQPPDGRWRQVRNDQVTTFDPKGDIPADGVTLFCPFCISGMDAVSWKWFDWACKAILNAGGAITKANCDDIENEVPF